MFDKYSLEISKIFKDAEREMLELKHPYVGSEHLLLSLMKNDVEIKELLENYDLTYDNFKQELILVVGNASSESPFVLYTPLLKRIISSALDDAKKEKQKLKPMHLLLSLIEEGEGIAIRILMGMGINIDKLYDEVKKANNNSKGKLEILEIGKNLQESVAMDELVVGRDKEINLIIETLIRKNKNNPLLIGEAGVGKSAIVEELARRINKGEVPKSLKNKKIVALEMSALVAGTKYRGEFEEKLNKIIKELKSNPDIILFIDEAHTMVNAGGAEGAINASDILKPYLARGEIKIIGATTTGEYHKFIMKDKALNRRFEVIKIVEPNRLETIDILTKIKPMYEKHFNIKISDENIINIVDLANRYIVDKFNPDKSIDILDSVCAMAAVEGTGEKELRCLEEKLDSVVKEKELMVKANNFKKALSLCNKENKLLKKIENFNKKRIEITEDEIKRYIYRKTNIPLINKKEEVYVNLKEYLNNNLIGQENVIERIVDNMENHQGNIPLSLLFCGDTGVGKTKSVKLISEYLKIPLIRLDMSEYNNETAINRLIGASAGYVGYDDEAIFDKVRMHPYSIILVDELEKASPNVINLFLQILDEGILTNAKGEKIDFKNTYIFMTSNVGTTNNIGFMNNSTNYNDYFSKEFIARFTDIIRFNSITDDMINKYLEKKNISDKEIIKDYDYHNLGFRGLDKYIIKKLKQTS